MSTLADNAGYRSLKAFVQPYQTLGRCGKTQQESAQWEKSGHGGAETRSSRDSGLPQSICVSAGPNKTISHLLLFVETGLMIAAHSLSRYDSDWL